MYEELKDFGLTENEIKIYVMLLKLGSSTPNEISQKTGFSRPYVYDVLERLLEKQIVSTILKNKKKNYTAIDPENLVELATQRLDSIKNILPDLNLIKKSSADEIKVDLHKGKYVYKILLQDILSTVNKNEEVLVYGIDDQILDTMDKYTPIYLEQYFKRASKLKIFERLIVKESNKSPSKTKITNYKFIPKDKIGDTIFEVYGNKVAILLLGDPNNLIIIKNKNVADSYRKQFELLWKIAKK